MTLDEVLDMWDVDSIHDPLELGEGALKIARLHAKYLRFLAIERLRLNKLQAEGRELRLAKHEFYTQGPTRESAEKGWQYPPVGKILVKDLSLYMDADPQMIEHNLKVCYQDQVVEALNLIFKSIQNRAWEIGRKLEDQKMKMGN